MKNKVALVTGSSGFIGTNLCTALRNKLGFFVIGVDLRVPQVHQSLDLFLQFDIRESNRFSKIKEAIPGRLDCVFHLAAQTSARVSEESPDIDISTNCLGTLNVTNFCEYIAEMYGNYPKIIFSSSMAVYGNAVLPIEVSGKLEPTSVYGASKIFGENILRRYSFSGGSFSIARIFNCYGPYQDMGNSKQGMLSIFLAQARNDKKYSVTGSLDRTRDFVYISDVIDGLTSDEFLSMKNQVVNFCSGIETQVLELLNSITKCLKIAPGEISIVEVGEHSGDIFRSVGDSRFFSKLVGKKSLVLLEEGLSNFIRYLDNG